MLRSVASGRKVAAGGAKPDVLPLSVRRNSRGIQDSDLDRDCLANYPAQTFPVLRMAGPNRQARMMADAAERINPR